MTGADILKAMAQGNNGKAFKLASSDSAYATIVSGSGITNTVDAEVAGGIALRAMAKNSKFANATSGTEAAKKAIEESAVSAVTKALNTLTIAIRKTIDEELKKVKEAMKINPETTPVNSEAGNVTK